LDGSGFIVNDALVDLLVSLLKVATRIGRPMRDGVSDPEDVSVTELRIVLMLGGEGALAGHELAELMAMQPMNVSRALSNLLASGLVKTVDNTKNRRRKPYQLTASGLQKFQAMKVRMMGVAEFVFSDFDAAERRILAKFFAKMDGRLIDWESPPEPHHVPRA
jgi:DNA-binding MarR family transcriptional regulator